MRSLCRNIYWAKHFSDNHCNPPILRVECTADIFYSREEVQFLTLGLKITLQWSKSWRMSRGGMIGRERGWTGTFLILTMVAQWKKNAAEQTCLHPVNFWKELWPFGTELLLENSLETGYCSQALWARWDLGWDSSHSASDICIVAVWTPCPFVTGEEHTSGMCNPADPLWTSTAGWKEEHKWTAHSVPAESKRHL